MPLFLNADVDIIRYSGCREGSSITRFFDKTKDSHHIEADLLVSEHLTRAKDRIHLEAGQTYRDYTIRDVHYMPTVVVSPKESETFSSICLVLYAVDPGQDLSERSDAVYVWEKDANSVKVLSGGGYSLGRRNRDNIILRVACARDRIVAIQKDRSYDELQPGDTIYVVTNKGAEEIVLSSENMKNVLFEHKISRQLTPKWRRI